MPNNERSNQHDPPKPSRTAMDGRVSEPIRLADFHARPTLAMFFPLHFPSGAKWIEFTGRCNQCEAKFDTEALRGDVERIADTDYRTDTTRAYYIDAWGYCEPCSLVTRFTYLLPDTLELVGVDLERRELLVYEPRKSLLSRMWARVRAMFRHFRPDGSYGPGVG